jgi:hypothetical protein
VLNAPQRLVLPRVVLRLRYYQFLLGFALAVVGIVGLDLHYFGSQCALGIISGVIVLVAVAWTDPRRGQFCFGNHDRLQYAIFMAVNGLASVAVLTYAVFHSYGIYVDSNRNDIDRTSAVIYQGVGVGLSCVLMAVIFSKWAKTKSLAEETATPESPPPSHLPPLPEDIIKLNICIVFFCCVTLFSIGACGFHWRYYGYKLGVAFICSGVAFLALVYCGDPRSKVRGHETRNKTVYQVINSIVILLAACYVCFHSYGISVDINLKVTCVWNRSVLINTTTPICHLLNSLSETPKDIDESSQRIYLQTLGIFFACLMIFTHVLKWKKLKAEKLL